MLCWNQVHETIARVVGVEPRIVHVPSDFIARIDARRGASLLGDKAWSLVFDNTRIRSIVPGFRARVAFEEGVRASITWLEADPARQRIYANETVKPAPWPPGDAPWRRWRSSERSTVSASSAADYTRIQSPTLQKSRRVRVAAIHDPV